MRPYQRMWRLVRVAAGRSAIMNNRPYQLSATMRSVSPCLTPPNTNVISPARNLRRRHTVRTTGSHARTHARIHTNTHILTPADSHRATAVESFRVSPYTPRYSLHNPNRYIMTIHYNFPYNVTPWSRVILGKLTVAQLDRARTSLYGIKT
jgi:hypothetical protein